MSQDNIVRLQCTTCKNFNYFTHKNTKRQDQEKLELKKFCKTCKNRTDHKEKAKK